MIKFLDLKKINNSYEPELSEAIKRVTHSGWYLLGEEIKTFERQYASFIGTRQCVGVASGLDALRLIIRAYIEMGELAEGDEIIVPANTYIASILAITENRLTPVLVEPELKTYNIDPLKIEEKITNRTRAIMIVHLYGQNAMHQAIQKLIDRYELILIEDNAQAPGAYYSTAETTKPDSKKGHHFPCDQSEVNQKRTGSIGHSAAHSFYPGKNLGALGDGGAVTTNSDDLSEVIRSIANYGFKKKYYCTYKGLNSRLDEIQAAVLKVKLKHLDRDNKKRRDIAKYYLDNIKQPGISLPIVSAPPSRPNDFSHVWHLFVIRAKSRDKLQAYLFENGIQTLIHYPVPPHKQKAYKEWNHLRFPITEKIHNEVLSMPISQAMRDIEVEMVVHMLNNF
jgi:dTDP-4-amino-4,6-dideoxygalactose transaminase